jgi:hypothetical protein
MSVTTLRAPVARDDRRLEALLDDLAATKRLLAGIAVSCDRLADHVVHPARPGDSVCSRYRAAVAAWPATPSPSPSYERLAGLASCLRDAAAAIRRAEVRVDEAARPL